MRANKLDGTRVSVAAAEVSDEDLLAKEKAKLAALTPSAGNDDIESLGLSEPLLVRSVERAGVPAALPAARATLAVPLQSGASTSPGASGERTTVGRLTAVTPAAATRSTSLTSAVGTGTHNRPDDVTRVQQRLKDLGFKVTVSGRFDPGTAERVMAERGKSGRFNRPITTEISAARKFYSAEDYHQKYLTKNPGGYTCHILRD